MKSEATPGREELLALREIAAFNITPSTGASVAMRMRDIACNAINAATARLAAAKPTDEGLREALEPFARAFEALTDEDLSVDGVDEMKISDVLYEPDYPTIGDLRKAHAVLSTTGNPKP